MKKLLPLLLLLPLAATAQVKIPKNANRFTYYQIEYGEHNDTTALTVLREGDVVTIVTPQPEGKLIPGYAQTVTEADCIADTLCYGDTGEGKAANTRALVERNGFRNPAYVGDIQGDQDAAHEAGCAFIHAAYGFGTADAPEAVIDSFPALLTLVK